MINPELKKIVNVYQVQFKGFKAPGLGDFVRGCLSMCQFINVINAAYGTAIEFDIDVSNHPMSKYLHPNKFNAQYETVDEFKMNPQKVVDSDSEAAMLNEITQRFNALPVDSALKKCPMSPSDVPADAVPAPRKPTRRVARKSVLPERSNVTSDRAALEAVMFSSTIFSTPFFPITVGTPI